MAVAVGVRAAPAPGLAWARVLEELSGSYTGRGEERGGGDGKGNCSSQQPTGFGQRREGSWELWFYGRVADTGRQSACPAPSRTLMGNRRTRQQRVHGSN